MAAEKGRSLLLKIESSAGSGTYNTIANLTTASITINNSTTDITNKSSNGYRTLLEGAGTKGADISFDGFLTGTTEQNLLLTHAQTDILYNYQFYYADTGKTVTAAFQMTNLSINDNGVEGAQTISGSLISSGQITYA